MVQRGEQNMKEKNWQELSFVISKYEVCLPEKEGEGGGGEEQE